MIDHFRNFAAYNAWANRAIYAEAATLSPSVFRENRGAFFGSLHGTLNHLLVTDRIWMRRFTGTGDAPGRLDAILYDDVDSLRQARIAEDQRIIDWLYSLDDAALAQDISYSPITHPAPVTHALSVGLAHLFNHQTHHRGQCHTILTSLGRPSIMLDLIHFLRTDGAGLPNV